jgi:hypothetical protein
MSVLQPPFQPNVPSSAASAHAKNVQVAYQTAGRSRLHRRVGLKRSLLMNNRGTQANQLVRHAAAELPAKQDQDRQGGPEERLCITPTPPHTGCNKRDYRRKKNAAKGDTKGF